MQLSINQQIDLDLVIERYLDNKIPEYQRPSKWLPRYFRRLRTNINY